MSTGMGIIVEGFGRMMKRVNYGRRLNRRLHPWNSKKLQSYIGYKAKLNGLPVIYVNPENASNLCPILGEMLASNGYRQLKCECGYEKDRDVTACLSMLRMRESRCPESIHETLRAEWNGFYEMLTTVALICMLGRASAGRDVSKLRLRIKNPQAYSRVCRQKHTAHV